jgi:hypothetical protein
MLAKEYHKVLENELGGVIAEFGKNSTLRLKPAPSKLPKITI